MEREGSTHVGMGAADLPRRGVGALGSTKHAFLLLGVDADGAAEWMVVRGKRSEANDDQHKAEDEPTHT